MEHTLVQLRNKFIYTLLLYTLVSAPHTAEVNFDVLLERTPYAQLLRELIIITDTVSLLNHASTDMAEKRFIEDSIIGKLVRAKELLKALDRVSILPEDVDYLHYWIQLAKRERLPDLLGREIESFLASLTRHFENIAD